MNPKPFYKPAGVFAALMMIFCAQTSALATDIYVNQATGVNSSSTAGTAAASPFKSVTYAMLSMASRSTPDPWAVHIKAGTYDADPAKAASRREIKHIIRENESRGLGISVISCREAAKLVIPESMLTQHKIL